MRALIVLLPLLLAACSAPVPPAEAQPPTAPLPMVVGTVAAIDLDPWTYDGDAEITLTTQRGRDVTVLVPARINLCEAEGLDRVGELEVGQGVRVVGAFNDRGTTVRPCDSPTHGIERVPEIDVAPPGPGTFRGMYLFGFEASLFRPCDSQETWWLRPNAAFNEALRPIADEHLSREELGDRILVETTVEGTLSERRDGGYGHMGAFDRQLVVTGLEAMTFVPSDASTPLACP